MRRFGSFPWQLRPDIKMGPVPFPYWLADEYGIEPSKSKKKSDILKDKEMKQWHTSLVSISSEIIVYL